MISIQPAQSGQGKICEEILDTLPDWFGIPEANRHYINYVEHNPTYVALVDSTPVGFLALMHHFPESAEIYVMGVRPEYHRMGIGRLLIESAERDLRQMGTRFLQVKTLSMSHPDKAYEKTRLFYLGMGFILLQEFEDLWGKENPALQLVKVLD